MEIEFRWQGKGHWPVLAGGFLLVVLLSGLALLGRAVSPVAEGQVALLTPEQWQAMALGRQVAAETGRLQEDVKNVHALLESDALDPVDAMLLAERVYARQRAGTSATAPARQAIVAAAAEAAHYATGAGARQDAVDAYEAALALANTLTFGRRDAGLASPPPDPVRP